MYTILTEVQRDEIYNKLDIDRRINDYTKPSESECYIAFKNGLSASLTIDSNDILSVVFKSMGGDKDANTFEELSTDCKEVVDDITTYLQTFLDDDVAERLDNYKFTIHLDEPPYSSCLTISVRQELLDIPSKTVTFTINDTENVIEIPEKYLEDNTIEDYIESVWWRSLSNYKKLEAAGLDTWNLTEFEVER